MNSSRAGKLCRSAKEDGVHGACLVRIQTIDAYDSTLGSFECQASGLGEGSAIELLLAAHYT